MVNQAEHVQRGIAAMRNIAAILSEMEEGEARGFVADFQRLADEWQHA